MAQGHAGKREDRGGPLSDASHRWRRDPLKGELPTLAHYETPRTLAPVRGEWEGRSPLAHDVGLLHKLVGIVRGVESASVAPHASVLHQKYGEIERLVDPRSEHADCPEAEWMRETLRATVAVGARKHLAGALSVTQFSGTGEYWAILWRHVRRRLAEKAMCAVRDLQELRHDRSIEARASQQKRLAVLAQLLALDEDIAVGFMKNGYDAFNKEFVRCPDLEEAQRFLQAIGAPYNHVPLPVRPRIRGFRMPFLEV
jgi:hypothetical protein